MEAVDDLLRAQRWKAGFKHRPCFQNQPASNQSVFKNLLILEDTKFVNT